jgi:redox-regulated HSP33 family molecular chaperone
LVEEDVRGVGVRLARSLQLGAIAAFTLAVVAFALGETVAATVMFMVAAVGFLVVLVLQRRR